MTSEPVTLVNDTLVYTILPVMPQFGNDKEDLQNYITKESKLRISRQQSSSTKNVFAEIIVEKNGKAHFERIVRGADSKRDAEARRIIDTMPNWTPGRMSNDEPARCRYLIPFFFE
jgi:hypothetical protein